MERQEDVAVFMDYENIYISLRNRYDVNPNFESIMEKCQEYGRVTIARAYADWYRYPRVTNALYANSIEPMYVPTYYYDRDTSHGSRAIRNSVDIHLSLGIMRTLYEHPSIETYVLVTGDRDFIPLVNAIRQRGKRAIVIGVGGAASSHLAQSADEFIFYRQLAEIEVEGEEKDPYEVLVEALKLARERGNAPTLSLLKLIMIELLGRFDESEYKDPQGKSFSKFKGFVREAERRGLVQIFTSGTVNEVFLPGEDPHKLSRFAPDVPTPEEEQTPEPEEEQRPEPEEITSGEWEIFKEHMRQFDEPVLFVQIYNMLRGLRNQEVIDRSNREIQRMIKQAIRKGLLIRTRRERRNFYQLNPEVSP